MKKSWVIVFLIPILTFAYPIYEDDVIPRQSKTLPQGSVSEKEITSETESVQEDCENKILQKSIKRREMKERIILQDKKNINSQAKSESSSEKKQSSISKSDPIKKQSTIQSNRPRPKHRQNPNRPYVMHRHGQKQSKDLSKIEADADEIEEGLNTHENEEWTGQENNSTQREVNVHLPPSSAGEKKCEA